MRYRVFPYKQGSRSARALADALPRGRVLRLEGSTFRPRRNDLIINWGASAWPYLAQGQIMLNHPMNTQIAADKLRAFRAFQEGGVSTPQFWTNRDEIPAEVFAPRRDADPRIVCRTVLNGHSGRGIVLAATQAELVNAPLYVEYKKKQDEYRVHVVKTSRTCNKIQQRLSCNECGYPEAEAEGNGDYLGPCDRGMSVIAVQRKARRRDVTDENVNWQVRNHANGFVFARDNVVAPDAVVRQSIMAIAALGLDFGGVDVIWNAREERAYVLEVNTACGLEGQTVMDYANAFQRIAAGEG